MKHAKTIALVVLFIFLIAIGGFIYYYYNVQQDALSAFAKDPNVAKVADVYNTGTIDSAVSQAESVSSSNPGDENALLALAVTYAEKGTVSFQQTTYGQKAIDTVNQVLAVDPNNSEAHRVLGYAYEIMQQYDKAIPEYQRAIELDPKNAQAYSNLGHTYDLQGNLQTAIQWYEKALAISPTEDHALLNMGRADIRLNATSSAVDDLQKLISVTQNNRYKAEAYQLLAQIYMQSAGEDVSSIYDQAEEYLTLSIQYDPTEPQTWVSLGHLRYMNLINIFNPAKTKETEDDIQFDVNKALLINKNQASAYYLDYQLALEEGDETSAAKYKAETIAAIPLDITLGQNEKQSLLLLTSVNATLTGSVQVGQ